MIRPVCLVAVCFVINCLTAVSLVAAEPDERLTKIGTWDGVTESAELEEPYVDRRQQDVPFGKYSFYLTPWRAYMDTWPAGRLLECPGTNFNVPEKHAEAAAEMLAAAGICSGRVEIGWGSFDYDAPDRLPARDAETAKLRLQALARHGIRPLLLLNGHHGIPCPARYQEIKLKADAAAGDRAVVLDDVKALRVGYSGLTGLTTYKAAEAIITAFDEKTGRCELSKPLPKALKAGDKVKLHTLKYQPFAGAVLGDGSPNPAAQETLDGWMLYVKGICRLTREALGTAGKADAGFDLEVWNEYSFGSNFLDEKHYYDPPRKFKEPITYSRHGLTRTGVEIILPMTVDYVRDPKNGLPGVKVISGFANQRPWENGAEMWPGQTGFSRHYYTNLNTASVDPTKAIKKGQQCLNYAGRADAEPFVPTVFDAFPERWHYAYQTEFMTRDVQPFPGPWKDHWRGSKPAGGQPAEVWMTEFNLHRRPFAEMLIKETGCAKDDPRLAALMHQIGAKALLRSVVFHSHKGVQTIDFYAAKEKDLDFAMLPEAFFQQLDRDGGSLTPASRGLVGPQLTVLRRVVELMRQGKRLDAVHPLSVERLVEHRPRLAVAGDGTAEHPDRFHRHDFAALPFQLDAKRYAVAFYVVTRNLGHSWRPQLDRLDAARYDMPEQTFAVTLGNLPGKVSAAAVYDPMSNEKVQPDTAATEHAIKTNLEAVDYPRFLLIDVR